jgi:hypothetical protein
MKNLTEFLESNCELKEEEMNEVKGGGGSVTYGMSAHLASMATAQLFGNTVDPETYVYGWDMTFQ